MGFPTGAAAESRETGFIEVFLFKERSRLSAVGETVIFAMLVPSWFIL
jgi:hypothetical protein